MALLRKRKHNRWFLQEVVAPREGDTFVDIGCGPAEILGGLPSLNYVGLDISEAYIREASQRWAGQGQFIGGSVTDWQADPRVRDADIVHINGVLHHCDDRVAGELLELSRTALKPGGRLVCYEPVYLRWQSDFGRRMMGLDRGQHIRTEAAWKALLAPLEGASTSITADINRLGYSGIVIEYTRPAVPGSRSGERL